MDLDTALQDVSAGILGIRVRTKHEAKTCVNHAKKLGLRRVLDDMDGVPDIWNVFGLFSGAPPTATFWKDGSDFTKTHKIVDFCDLFDVAVNVSDIANLL